MIGIRVDANEKIAMGHMMRCISIALQLRKRGQEILFILSEDYASDLLTSRGFPYICLDNAYCDKDLEIPVMMHCIASQKIKLLLIDSYEVTEKYMEQLRSSTKLAYIDDLNRFRYPADLIINYMMNAGEEIYRGKGYQKETFLLGSRYIPLRPEFADERIAIKDRVQRIFLTTGGTDEFDMICHILHSIEKSVLNDVEICVVTGKFYRFGEKLCRIAGNNNKVQVHHDVSDICALMRQCDLAVSAGGTTLAELSACGIPTVCFAIADNQLQGINAYAQNDIMYYAGDVRTDRNRVLQQIIEKIVCLRNDKKMREELGRNAKTMIDGRGAGRLAEAIIMEKDK